MISRSLDGEMTADISNHELEVLRQNLEDKLNRLTDKVDRLCGYTS